MLLWLLRALSRVILACAISDQCEHNHNLYISQCQLFNIFLFLICLATHQTFLTCTVVFTFESVWMKTYGVTTQMKPLW